MAANDAINYLIDKTTSIVTAYSGMLPMSGNAVVYRITGGQSTNTLSKKRQYQTHQFNAIVRGGTNDEAVAVLADSLVIALDMDNTNIVQCNVTEEPQYAYKDENNNIHYSFSGEVII